MPVHLRHYCENLHDICTEGFEIHTKKHLAAVYLQIYWMRLWVASYDNLKYPHQLI